MALQMIVTGKAISAEQALAAGVIDMLVDEDSDFLAAVIDYAKTLVQWCCC